MSNFWHKKSVSWPLAGSVSLIHSLTRCLAVIYPKTFFPGSLSAYLLSARHCCRHRKDDSEQNKQHPFFCGVFFFPQEFLFSFRAYTTPYPQEPILTDLELIKVEGLLHFFFFLFCYPMCIVSHTEENTILNGVLKYIPLILHESNKKFSLMYGII